MNYPNYNTYPSNYGQVLYPQNQNYIQQNMNPNPNMLIEVKYAKYDEAIPFLVTEPNKKILFIITDKQMMIFKSTDSMGISTTEMYKTEKIDNETNETKALSFNPDEFVKTDDLNNRLEDLNKSIAKQIDDLSRKIKIKEIMEVNDVK